MTKQGWAGNPLTTGCTLTLEHVRAELIHSRIVRHWDDPYPPRRYGKDGETFWNLDVYDLSPWVFDKRPFVSLIVGPVNINRAKDEAAKVAALIDRGYAGE